MSEGLGFVLVAIAFCQFCFVVFMIVDHIVFWDWIKQQPESTKMSIVRHRHDRWPFVIGPHWK